MIEYGKVGKRLILEECSEEASMSQVSDIV